MRILRVKVEIYNKNTKEFRNKRKVRLFHASISDSQIITKGRFIARKLKRDLNYQEEGQKERVRIDIEIADGEVYYAQTL